MRFNRMSFVPTRLGYPGLPGIITLSASDEQSSVAGKGVFRTNLSILDTWFTGGLGSCICQTSSPESLVDGALAGELCRFGSSSGAAAAPFPEASASQVSVALRSTSILQCSLTDCLLVPDDYRSLHQNLCSCYLFPV